MALDKNKFVLKKNTFEEAEKLSEKSITFWQDAMRRLRQNKASMIGVWIIVFLVVMSYIGYMDPLVGNNADGSRFTYRSAPILVDEDGVEIPKEDIAFVPARMPLLEKIGIFDGTTQIEIGSFDIIIGTLPKTDEFNTLKKPQNRKKLVEALGIPYHPFEVNILDIYHENDVLMAKIKVVLTEEEVVLPYEELVSEYTKYRDGNFEFVRSDVDDKGIEMVTIKADYYEIQGIKNLYFWFGTDKLALDNWARQWYGLRISLRLALICLIIDFALGITYGTIAGFFGGTTVDNLMMRFTEILGSIPFIVIMIIILSLQPEIEKVLKNINPDMEYTTVRFIILVFALSLTGWIGVARIVRAQILKLRDQEFILASRTLGASNARLMAKHLFPNIIGQLVVLATFSVPGTISSEAFLTFFGLGLPIPMASLGTMLKDGYYSFKTIPESLWIPAIIMSALMLAINLLANGLRDALDPRMR